MVFASGLSRLALGRAPLGMGCRAPSLRLGPTGFHPARLRAPLAIATQPPDDRLSVREAADDCACYSPHKGLHSSIQGMDGLGSLRLPVLDMILSCACLR